MKYSQLIIPACHTCNSDRFGTLESKVRRRIATENDYFIWALKIRYGFAIKDSSLLFDRSNPELGFVLPQHEIDLDIDFFSHLVRNFDQDGFVLFPKPFASVFRFKQPQHFYGDFFLIDVPPPYWSLLITLPPDEVLIVLLNDRGTVKQYEKLLTGRASSFAVLWEEIKTEVRMKDHCSTFLFRMLCFQGMLNVDEQLKYGKNSLFGKFPARRKKLTPQAHNWYRILAKNCAFPPDEADRICVSDHHHYGGRFLRSR